VLLEQCCIQPTGIKRQHLRTRSPVNAAGNSSEQDDGFLASFAA
jgi:hypothetical protein